jgi:hypothetical protein
MVQRREAETVAMVNRSQGLVLAFFAAVLIALVAVRVGAPGVYTDELNLPAGASPILLDASVAAVIAFVALISIGVVGRRRWLFWLVVAAFVAGVLRLPVSMLELGRVLPATAPAWYLVLQAVIGVIQFAIGLALVRGYRKAGPWGAF